MDTLFDLLLLTSFLCALFTVLGLLAGMAEHGIRWLTRMR